jgi:hypothetical protein
MMLADFKALGDHGKRMGFGTRSEQRGEHMGDVTLHRTSFEKRMRLVFDEPPT